MQFSIIATILMALAPMASSLAVDSTMENSFSNLEVRAPPLWRFTCGREFPSGSNKICKNKIITKQHCLDLCGSCHSTGSSGWSCRDYLDCPGSDVHTACNVRAQC